MKLQKGDIFIIFFILLFAVSIWIYPLFSAQQGSHAIISYGGEEKRVPIGKEEEYIFGGCKVKCENGEIYVFASDCPDHVCIKTGRISRAGSAIICIPNKLSIRIPGGKEFDAVAG